jgi:hypothetical protein
MQWCFCCVAAEHALLFELSLLLVVLAAQASWSLWEGVCR